MTTSSTDLKKLNEIIVKIQEEIENNNNSVEEVKVSDSISDFAEQDYEGDGAICRVKVVKKSNKTTNTSTEAVDEDAEEFEDTDEDTVVPHRLSSENPYLFDADDKKLQEFLLLNIFYGGNGTIKKRNYFNAFVNNVLNDIGCSVVSNIGILTAIFNSTENDAHMLSKISEWLKDIDDSNKDRIIEVIKQACIKVSTEKIKLKTAGRDKLLGIKGLGARAASEFLMYTRGNYRGICLSNYVLKYMREEAKINDVPFKNPRSKKDYVDVENKFLTLFDKEKGKPLIPEFDFKIWSKYNTAPSNP